jgi:lipid-binding SYLF domain-containing protein
MYSHFLSLDCKENTMLNMNHRRTFLKTAASLILAGSALAFGNIAAAADGKADGKIELVLYKAGFIVGGSGGSGKLIFKGKEYPLSIGGVSLGATIGASKAELIGEVLNLKNVSDIEGTYTAGQAGVAVAGGEKVAELKNSRGVQLKLKGKQVGLEFALDLSGMQLSLKK